MYRSYRPPTVIVWGSGFWPWRLWRF